MIILNEYDITAAFQAIENELIASMVRNMDRHRAEETKEGIQWSMWQAEQLKALEKYKRENQKKYQKQFRNINSDISTLIQQARATGNMQQEITILNAIKNGFKGAKKVSSGMTAEFFRLNDRKLEALIQATTHDMQRAETAILRMANDQYRKAIFNAQVYANSGAGTYEKAVDMATKNMLAAGLNCVEYKNGARHTLADYADMAIRTASKRAYLQGEGEKRQEWGISTVIMNKRGNPCPKCLPFVGKVLIDDVWSGGKKSDGPYPLMSTAIAAGLYHPRCKDSHTTYFSGISTADDTWTAEELEAIEKSNKQEAKKQYARRQVEKFGRLAEHSLDDENQKRYKQRAGEREKQVEKPADSDTIKEGRKLSLSNLDDFEKWQNEYYELNQNIDPSKENFPNINNYTGGSYAGINAVERFEKGSSQYDRYNKSYRGIERFKKISDGVSKEISKFQNPCDLQVYRYVGDVDYITGASSSLDDLTASIGKEYTEKGFISTTVCSDATLPFGGYKDTKTKLEIFVPKEARGAYIYKLSDSPAEFEYLIDKNTRFKVIDAGIRVAERKKWTGEVIKEQERFMKLEVIIDG